MKNIAKAAGYFRRAGGVNPLVTLLSQHGWFILIAVTKNYFSNNLQAVCKLLTLVIQIGNQLARESYQGHN